MKPSYNNNKNFADTNSIASYNQLKTILPE